MIIIKGIHCIFRKQLENLWIDQVFQPTHESIHSIRVYVFQQMYCHLQR